MKILEPNIVNCLKEQTHEGIKLYVNLHTIYSKAEKNEDRTTVEKTQIYAKEVKHTQYYMQMILMMSHQKFFKQFL